jgi:hypothetical protein
VSAIVLDLSATVTAGFYGGSDLVEGLGLALRVIEKAVVGGVKATGDREGVRHGDGYPVSESQSSPDHMSAEHDVPFRQIIEEERTSGLQDSDAFIHPSIAPGKIVVLIEIILECVAVILLEIEGRIREHGVHDSVPDAGQDIQTVVAEESSQSRDMMGVRGICLQEPIITEAGFRHGQ